MKKDKIYILVGELEGDYNDFYQRPKEEIASSFSVEKLKKLWNSFPIKIDNSREPEIKFHIYTDKNNTEWEFIDYYIAKLDII